MITTIKFFRSKKHLVLVLFSMLTLIFGCGGSGDDPVTPVADFQWTPVTEEPISTDGGTVTGDDFNLIIPAGAFAVEATVVVSSAKPADYPLQNPHFSTDTMIYRFSGLPEFSEPLTIEWAFDPAVHTTDESLAIYFEEDVFLDDEMDPVPVGWPLLDLVVDRGAGLIRATIPPHVYADEIDPQLKYSNDIDFVITRAQHNMQYTSNEDFTIGWLASEVNRAWVDGLLADLTAAKVKLEGLGFVLDRWSRIYVEAVPISGSDGNFIQSNFGLEFSRLQIDPSLDGTERLVSAGHELFHLFQQGYGNCGHRLRYSHYWLSEACSIWFEPVLLEDASYVATVQRANTNFICKGLEENTPDIGYGAGAFLTWLTEKYDRALVLEINRKVAEAPAIPGAGVHAVNEALLDRGSYLNAEFRQFAQEFSLGTTGHTGWAMPPNDVVILTKTLASKSVSLSAMDLSAHPILTAINLNTWPTDPSPPHYLAVDVGSSTPPYVEAFVYRSSTTTGPWSLGGVAEAGDPVMIAGFGVGSQEKVKVVLVNSKGDVPCTDVENTTVSFRLASCSETALVGHGNVFLAAHVMVRYGTAPGDSVPVTVVYNKVHCDGHLGTVGPVSGHTGSDGVYNTQTLANFNVYNEQELYRATATVRGVSKEKVFTLAEMERTLYFEPRIAEFIFEF